MKCLPVFHWHFFFSPLHLINVNACLCIDCNVAQKCPWWWTLDCTKIVCVYVVCDLFDLCTLPLELPHQEPVWVGKKNVPQMKGVTNCLSQQSPGIKTGRLVDSWCVQVTALPTGSDNSEPPNLESDLDGLNFISVPNCCHFTNKVGGTD